MVYYFETAEICASNDVNHFFLGNIRKVSFFEVGSKLKFFFFNHMPDIEQCHTSYTSPTV